MTVILPTSFFAAPTLRVARGLLGKRLVRRVGGRRLAGVITEVEAYCGEDDLACHASRGRTPRTEILYAKAGTLYVYLVYGMYWCLNIVTEKKNYPSAVLIRAIEPVEGIEVMKRNRKWKGGNLKGFANGPGKLCQAFDIKGDLHGKRLGRGTLWIEDAGEKVSRTHIMASPRIGVDYAKHCAKYPWRFALKSPSTKTQ